jgi:hypothetical protein
MSTGIEFGPDYCVLVGGRERGAAFELTAVRVFESAEWARDPDAQIAQLREARRELGLARRANVVSWGVSATTPEAVLDHAGFKPENSLAPVDALSFLGWSRANGRTDSAIACLSITDHGAAIAVVRGADVLFSDEFTWRIHASEQRVQANLLRRYLYVAQLTPELRRAMQTAEEQHQATIGFALVCGTVPDLRSLTMSLIRELDLEMDTLDSIDGLHVSAPASGIAAEHASAIQLAAAAAMWGAHARKGGWRRWFGAAAALMVTAGAALWAFSFWAASATPDVDRPADPAPAASAAVPDEPPRETVGTSPPPAPAPKPQHAQSTIGITGAERPEGESSVQPLPDPLPSVGGVLISGDRRLAVVDGAVVGIGDRIGPRTVARIESDAVVLREPSGRQVRVPIRKGTAGRVQP